MKKSNLRLAFILLLIISVSVFASSCTQNSRAKKWGGTASITLPTGKKLVNVTWKGESLWYMTRPMRSDDVAETYEFQEESSYGMIEGTYVIREVK
jgi:hypothetical protein